MFGRRLGVYLANSAPEELLVYTRLALDYRLMDTPFVSTSLKATVQNFSCPIDKIKKDCTDFRIGYSS